jgi:hypothetical protein
VQLSEEQSERAQVAWRSVIRQLLRVRSLQRKWSALGFFLQEFPESLRYRLRLVWLPPSGKPPVRKLLTTAKKLFARKRQ